MGREAAQAGRGAAPGWLGRPRRGEGRGAGLAGRPGRPVGLAPFFFFLFLFLILNSFELGWKMGLKFK